MSLYFLESYQQRGYPGLFVVCIVGATFAATFWYFLLGHGRYFAHDSVRQPQVKLLNVCLFRSPQPVLFGIVRLHLLIGQLRVLHAVPAALLQAVQWKLRGCSSASPQRPLPVVGERANGGYPGARLNLQRLYGPMRVLCE